jgi:hypothetical protein
LDQGTACASFPEKIAAVALANKMAHMSWALMMSGERYREPAVRGGMAA